MNVQKISVGLVSLIYALAGCYWYLVEMPGINREYAALGLETPFIIAVSPFFFVVFGLVIAPLCLYFKRTQLYLASAAVLPVVLYVVGGLVL